MPDFGVDAGPVDASLNLGGKGRTSDGWLASWMPQSIGGLFGLEFINFLFLIVLIVLVSLTYVKVAKSGVVVSGAAMP